VVEFLVSQSLQSSHVAFTFVVPTLTAVANGTIETLMSSFFLAALYSVSSRLFVAFLSSVILLLDDIDPVLSRASASSSRLIPHFTSELEPRSILVWPRTREN